MIRLALVLTLAALSGCVAAPPPPACQTIECLSRQVRDASNRADFWRIHQDATRASMPAPAPAPGAAATWRACTPNFSTGGCL